VTDQTEERFVEVWEHQWETNKYQHARSGDHLITPFECDRCVFIKLKGRLPIEGAPKDRLLNAAIRRVNLDALWSRETSTVAKNLAGVRKIIYTSDSVGLKGPFISFGPMPTHDHCGYEIAIDMVLASRSVGRHSKTHLQFETIRKLRTAYANFERASAAKAHNHLVLDGGAGESKEISDLITSSLWFRRFITGCKARMGQIHKPNLALTTELIVKLLSLITQQIQEAEQLKDQFDLVVFGNFVVFSYVLSLRGSEGAMLNLSTMAKYRDSSKDSFIVALKGKIKGEANERDHLFHCVNETSSGIKARVWIGLLMVVHEKAGRSGGPGITNWDGTILKSSELDDRLHELLMCLFDEGVKFPPEINTQEDIIERFSIFRSLRRASDTRALEKKVGESDIDVVNRWKSVEMAKGSRPGRSMRQHYAEVSNLKLPFLRYTQAM